MENDLQRGIATAIKAVLLDVEERSASSNLIKDHLEKLKDALYDADDLLDDIHTEALQKNLMTFWLLNGLKMGRKIKARLSSIQSEANMFNLVILWRRLSLSEGDSRCTLLCVKMK
ncbi:hypothetical protein V6N12_013211 [Hibiscus sabdariffa]|uniref:Disease resistance N-terminal domain-containing protein n=1 Tax=Hibiscus sabdariffa TaxID=183260 RepID=A0ABR2D6Q8_9ROSI